MENVMFMCAAVTLIAAMVRDGRRARFRALYYPATAAAGGIVLAVASLTGVGCRSVGEAMVDRTVGAPPRAACSHGAWRCSPSGVPQVCNVEPSTGVSRWLPTTPPAVDGGAPAPCGSCVVDGDGAHCGGAQ